jgi:glutamyl-Q tRNA(Asp) synthetase
MVAALGSFLQARALAGTWLVRIEDVDTPRVVPGADRQILETLQGFGLDWDEPVLYQSCRARAYEAAIEHLRRHRQVYPCGCSRAQVPGGIYPGRCREGLPKGAHPRSLRVRTERHPIEIDDRVQGRFAQRLHQEVGDFVVLRGDGVFAYQIAVVVDDAEQGVTEVVRGSDLLDSTPRQVHLQRLLGLPTPAYAHLPVAVDGNGQKLSKQTHALPVDPRRPVPLVVRVLEFLGQAPPWELQEASLDETLDWAIRNWSLARIPRRRSLPAPG